MARQSRAARRKAERTLLAEAPGGREGRRLAFYLDGKDSLNAIFYFAAEMRLNSGEYSEFNGVVILPDELGVAAPRFVDVERARAAFDALPEPTDE